MAGTRARRYPTDPEHPDFPHGTLHGYNGLSCRCGRCRRAVATSKARLAHRRLTGRVAGTDYIDAAPALARVRRWGETYSASQIARMTGLSANRVSELLNESKARSGKIRLSTHHAIMTTPDPDGEDVYVPIERYHQRAYSLAAIGYPLAWIASQLGLQNLPMRSPQGRARVRMSVFVRLDTLYRRIEATPAEEHPSRIPARARGIAKATARRHGYHPPGCYDDDGNLIPEAVRNEKNEARLAEQDRVVRQRLAALHLSLKGIPPGDVVARTGIGRDVLHKRVFPEAQVAFGTKSAPAGHVVVQVRPECTERAAWLLDQLDQFEVDILADPVDMAWRLGLRTGLRLTGTQRAELEKAYPETDDQDETEGAATTDQAPESHPMAA